MSQITLCAAFDGRPKTMRQLLTQLDTAVAWYPPAPNVRAARRMVRP
jgi:hypothetical protein